MTSRHRHGCYLGAAIVVALGIVVPAPVEASRPSTAVDVARVWQAAANVRAEMRASEADAWAGRTPRAGARPVRTAARRCAPEPPPATHLPDRSSGGSIGTRPDDGRRRAPDSGAALAPALHPRACCTVVAAGVRDQRADAPGAVFHEANAPPSPAIRAVAGFHS